MIRRAPLRAGAAMLCCVLAACNDTSDLAPASPSAPWRPDGAATGGAVAAGHPRLVYDLPHDPALPWPDPHPTIDPRHRYTLVELIDIAQRNNKQTRIEWERAKQAAIGVGIAQGAYLPRITLEALGGYRRQTSPFPKELSGNGDSYITSNATAVFPSLTIDYLLLDFGRRAASVEEARQSSVASNIVFTAAHQQVILDVTQAELSLQGAEADRAAAEQSLRNATLLADGAHDCYKHGEGTVTDIGDAERNVMQAKYDLTDKTARCDAARDSLATTLGLPPATPIQIVSLDQQPVPDGIDAALPELMHDALRRRPDLQADLAKLRASEAAEAEARSDLMPSLSIAAKGTEDIGRISTNRSPSTSFEAPEAGIYLDFRWTLFQGGERANLVRMAHSRRAEAEATLQQAEDQGMREVALAYDGLVSAVARYKAAIALRKAAKTAFDADAASFRQGVEPLTVASSAAASLDSASATVVRSHAGVLAASAVLAFATGRLTGSDGPGTMQATSRP